MKIYKSELQDGLGELLQANNTLAWCSVATNYEPVMPTKSSAIEKLIAENENQLDLYYLQSILVSTGWNKNDDVFDPQETWNAKSTPEDKPFNFMHNEKDIIGHITGNVVVDFDGTEIDAKDTHPDQFNILTTSVIYTEWSDIEQKERMQNIIAEIEEGKWFVSMECLFPDFDYALVDGTNMTKVIQRNEASAFLTKHLRSYGGNGTYENYRVGRLLRNLSFSGKGLVSKPANPRSVILDGNQSGNQLFDESQAQILTISSLKENKMSDNFEKQLSDLRHELAEAVTANDALREQVAAEKHAEFEAKIQAFEVDVEAKDTEIKGLSDTLEVLMAEIAEHIETIKTCEESIATKDEALATWEKKEVLMKRQARLEEIGFDTNEANVTMEKFSEMNDELFEQVIAILEKRPVCENQDVTASEELDEEVDSTEASDTDLDEVEETQEVTIAEAVGDEDAVHSLRTTASEWFSSVLQSVPQDK
tara:strand:+ start:11008 stop:12444 length:1437 start_codon:yes stop_codon:yes gene_type:complete